MDDRTDMQIVQEQLDTIAAILERIAVVLERFAKQYEVSNGILDD